MKSAKQTAVVVVAVLALLAASQVLAQDWPQWRGPNRDGKVTGFKAPDSWPKALNQKWKVSVGAGDASPVLVGGKLYVFARQGEDEVTLCLDAAEGKELWRDKNPVAAIPAPSGRQHGGPRSTPTVAEGKVVTLGVTGVLSCLDAATSKVIWRKDEIKGTPKFFTAMSPLVTEGLVIAQLGPEGSGAIVAYDLASGKEKWKCADQGASYASPVLLTVDGVKQFVTLTDKSVVGVALADGKVLWQIPFVPAGMAYNDATPVVDGSTVYVSGQGRGTKALKIEKKDKDLAATELWSNPLAVAFGTPELKDGCLYAVSDKGNLFCLNAKNGEMIWTDTAKLDKYGAVLDVGAALLVLPNNGQLLVIKPGEKQYTELAKYKVAEGGTYACPIAAGNRIFVKDADSLILWTLE
jgi:outer membrane protein assembly factor BamB